MKLHHITWLSLAGLLSVLLTSCDPWNMDRVSILDVQTLDYDEQELMATFSQTTLIGQITGLVSKDELENYGHVWQKGNSDPTLANKIRQSSFGPKTGDPIEVKTAITGLEPEESYAYRTYAIFQGKVSYGPVAYIEVPKEGFLLRSQQVKGYTLTTTGPRIEVVTDLFNLPAGVAIGDAGIVWGETPEPDIQTANVASVGSLISSSNQTTFTNTINGLTPGKTYYIKPYITLGEKQVYGSQISYTLNDIWVRKGNVPVGPCNFGNAFTLNGKGHLIGGGEQKTFEDHWIYDPSDDSWELEGYFPHLSRQNGVTFVIGDTVYFGSGFYDRSQPYFWKYSEADKWQPIATPGIAANVYVDGAWAFALNGKGYYGGGSIGQDGQLLDHFWEYTPQTGQWTNLGPLGGPDKPSPRTHAGTFVIDNVAYLGPGNNTPYNDFWSYKDGQWKPLRNCPQGIGAYYSGFAINGKGYFAMGGPGWNTNTMNRALWEYNPRSNNWIKRADFPAQGRNGGSAFVVNGRAYLGMGFDINHLDDWWEYIPPE